MAATMKTHTCATCHKGSGVAMCHGCEQTFCVKHFVEHRQGVSQQMDAIAQEHDLLRRDLKYEKDTTPLLTRIDRWEQESIYTIQTSAQKARADLQKFHDQKKTELKMSVEKLTEELRTCRESEDYTEIEIKKWNERLGELRQLVEHPLSINIEFNDSTESTISLIKVNGSKQALLSSSRVQQRNENEDRIFESFGLPFEEKFVDVYGDITLSIDGFSGCRSDNHWSGSCMSGSGRYSFGLHHIRFQIEHKVSDVLFVGVITASQPLTSSINETKSACGWWGLNTTVVNGRMTSDRRPYSNIKSGDEMTLTLDCDHRRLQLHHHRTKTLIDILIDLEMCPFPWKIVCRLDTVNDCVKLFH